MSVAVLVPWAGRCPHRLAAWKYVRSWYGNCYPDWEIRIGESRVGGQWCKAEAVANALKATSANILVVADADSLVPGVGSAVRRVKEGDPWAIPHYRVHRLTEESTKRVFAGEDPKQVIRERKAHVQQPYVGYPGGGVTVVHRDVYCQVPLDPRYRGWGQEDQSWAIALTLLHGAPWRSKDPLLHLWHPPQLRLNRVTGSHASRELLRQYQRVTTHRGMERLLDHAVHAVQAALEEKTPA